MDLLKRSVSRPNLAWVLPPTLFVLGMLLFYPFRFRIEFDPDEGINAIKAMMVLRGYRLYSEIWNDQPPVFSYLLAGWFRLFGLRLNAGRLLVLLSSAGLIAMASNYLRKNWGLLAGIVGGSTLVCLPFFPQLSVSLMIGLPAITLAFASFYVLAEWHTRPSLWRLLASASLLGLSILTKLLGVILVPVGLAGILLVVSRRSEDRKQGKRRWLEPVVWLGTLALLGAVSVGLIIGPQNLGQVLGVHLQAAQDEIFLSAEYPSLESFLAPSWALFVGAALGTAWAVRQRRWTALYLSGWLVVGYAFLTTSRPAWYHHQLFLTIPAAILSAVAVASSAEALRLPARRLLQPMNLALGLGSLGFFLAFLAVRVPGTLDGFNLRLPNLSGLPAYEAPERQVLAAMHRYRDQTNWLFTDRPMFAFLAEISVPPRLAVVTQKRMLTGNLTDEEIRATLLEYSPEMVLIGRMRLPVLDEYMRIRNFLRIDETLKYRLYWRPPS